MARKPGSAEYNQKKRFRAVEIIFNENRTQSEAAKELKVHLRTIQHWVALYRKYDLVGLLSGKATGRPRKLNDKQLKVINEILLKGPRAQGYANDLWTSRRILKLIKKLTGVEYHFNHIPRLLRNMGWTPQRPQREAIEKDQKQIDDWIHVEWKRIKKKPRRKNLQSSL